MSRLVGGGSVFKRASGRWVGEIDSGWSEGKRARRTVYGDSRASVVDQLKTLAHNRELGAVQAGKVPTVGTFLEQWLQESAKPTVRPSTFVSYSTIVKAHLVPGLGRVRLDRLTPQMVQTFLNQKHAAGLSPRRVEYIRAVLRRALGQAVKWRTLPQNVASLVDPPKVEHRLVAPMTPADAQAVVAAFQGHRLEGLVTVMLGLGLRLGEALGLKWSEVDLDLRRVSIVATLQRLPDEDGVRQWVLGKPKSSQSNRTFPLPEVVTDALQAERSRQRRAQLAAGPAWQETGFVFTGQTGQPWTQNGALHAFQHQLAVAGIPKMRLHDLRHGCATLLLAKKVPARVVMEILGHSQISMTMNTYSHVVPDLLSDAAEAMDAALRPA
ncbi:MAG TPA: site-specific integrase [Candidatus Dormibacteraeota bacterium]|nr:site-specific integrase [Candidatus Dormibacteraeota bacterium]